MALTSCFAEDPDVKAAVHAAAKAASAQLLAALPQLASVAMDVPAGLEAAIAAQLNALLVTDQAQFPALVHGADAFGDRFDLAALPLARPGTGYAVQLLDSDALLDRDTGTFLPVRNSTLNGLFPDFDSAYAAARQWLELNNSNTETHPLAIVPACKDAQLERHVLIYGVLTRSP